MKLLGIETSCDETAAAIVEDGVRLVANVVASQVQLHAPHGGVIPEVAARAHLTTVLPVLRETLAQAHIGWKDLDGIAVTYGPGLAGALLVGVSVAKSLAMALGLPLIPVNHLEGHFYAAWLDAEAPVFPALGLVVSGGHSDLVALGGHGRQHLLGATRDDAAGEAFDKAARILGLGFPGGPAIQRAAVSGDPSRYTLPRAWLPETNDFSFSGLKTALLRQAIVLGLYEPDRGPVGTEDRAQDVADLAASFQEAVADVLVEKTVAVARRHHVKSVILAGGVAANARLRALLRDASPIPVHVPPVALCTDNAAMIAAAGAFQRLHSPQEAYLDLDVAPGLRFT
jgi:N6-L-threonylcarbamoyladenine synthase